jgi:hypothetical protein
MFEIEGQLLMGELRWAMDGAKEQDCRALPRVHVASARPRPSNPVEHLSGPPITTAPPPISCSATLPRIWFVGCNAVREKHRLTFRQSRFWDQQAGRRTCRGASPTTRARAGEGMGGSASSRRAWGLKVTCVPRLLTPCSVQRQRLVQYLEDRGCPLACEPLRYPLLGRNPSLELRSHPEIRVSDQELQFSLPRSDKTNRIILA